MSRFFLNSDEQQSSLLEVIKAVLRSWDQGSYEIEHQEYADSIISWAKYFLDKFSVFPKPVYWELNRDEEQILRWMIDFYTNDTSLPLINKRSKTVVEDSLAMLGNFNQAA